jgi:HK97 family phage major capsid protein
MNVDAGRERELSQEMARRSGKDPQGIFAPTSIFEKRVVTSPNSSGGHIIPTEHMDGQFIDLLRANTIVRELGARVMNNLSGNVDIPKHKSSTNVQWVAENSGLSSSDIDFDNVTLSPKHAGALGEYSRNMLQQSSPDIEDLFRRDMAANLGEALDSVALNGGGSNEPTGILATTGVNDVDFSTGEAYKNLQELITTVDEQNTTGTGFAMHPRVRNFFKTVLDADGKPFIMPDRNRLEGLPARVSTLLPTTSGSPDTSKMIFGNWSDLLIGFWSEIDVLVNPYESTAYNKGNVKVRAMMTADVALRHKESFAIGKNIDIS